MATSDAAQQSTPTRTSTQQSFRAPASRHARPQATVSGRHGDDARDRDAAGAGVNVAAGERVLSVAASALLLGLGLARRDLRGLLMLGAGGALAYRGMTGHSHLYEATGVNTAHSKSFDKSDQRGVHVTECFLIDQPATELYRQWRDFEQLPKFMTHLESVQILDDRRSLWTCKAPLIAGGRMEWEAEITIERPPEQIAWQTLPGSDLQHHGSIRFRPALGNRGTNVRVDLQYASPAGQLGRWLAMLFGVQPQQQIRSDLRKFKQLMETGEIATVAGQPHGTCHGAGGLRTQ